MKTRTVFSILLIISLLIALTPAVAMASGDDIREREVPGWHPPKFVEGELLVKFKPGVSEETIEEINENYGAKRFYHSTRGRFDRLRILKKKTVEEIVQAYRQDPNVEYAAPNIICEAVWSPNDQYYSMQWHFDLINMEGAWDIEQGDPSIRVAVLDTGVAYEDYDDANEGYNYRLAPDLVQTNFFVSSTDFSDFINNDYHPNDNNAHGTHVAGTIAQSTNNSIGVAGMAFNGTIMPVKVLDYTGSGTIQTLADGIYYAVDHGAKVINMSLGFPLGTDPADIAPVHEAVSYAYNSGVVLCAAAGNDASGWRYSGGIILPAAYPEVIAVGAVHSGDARTDYSNYGAELEVAAPGGDGEDRDGNGYMDGVLQQTFEPYEGGWRETLADPTDFGYWFYAGTSMATPHVSGLVALLLSQESGRSVEQIRDILHTTSVDLGAPGWDEEYGHGRIDALAALQATPNESPVANAGPNQTADEGALVDFDGSGSYDSDGSIVSYSWGFGDGAIASGAIVSHAYADNGEYMVTLTVTDDLGTTGTDTAIVTVNNVAPTAEAGGPYIGDEGSAITFNGSATDPGTADTLIYEWDFDGDEVTDATGATPSWTWSDNWSGIVTLKVTDDDDGAGTDTASVTVSNVAPTADAGGPYTGIAGQPVTFAGSATDPGADTLTYQWDFEYVDATFTIDASGVDLVSPSHTYTIQGEYMVALCVSDEDGGVSSISTAIVTVNPPNEPPVADANGPYSGTEGSPVTFDASASYDPEETALTYEWDWDNDGTYDVSTSSPTIEHTWTDDYIGTVVLRVTDNTGLTDTAAANVTISNIAPSADAGGPYSGSVGTPITFTGSATDPGADTLTYQWNFGDETTGSGATVEHAYSEAGTYTVTLTVTDDDGGAGTDTATVTVEAAAEQGFTFTGSVEPGQESRHIVSVGPGAQSLYVKLTWSGYKSDLRLRVYNPAGELIAEVDESSWQNQIEEITISNPAEGDWRVAAYAEETRWPSAETISYTIEGTIAY